MESEEENWIDSSPPNFELNDNYTNGQDSQPSKEFEQPSWLQQEKKSAYSVFKQFSQQNLGENGDVSP